MSGPARDRRLARLHRLVWGEHDWARGGWQSGSLRVARTLSSLGRDLAGGQLTLRAMGLVYTTLLSIVPLLALSFSVLKAFGVANQVRPMLQSFLAPLGEKGDEIVRRVIDFIQNMNVGVLGAVGLALLLYTAVSLVQKIEESLNFIWHVPRPRSIGERFSRYLSVLLVGPILVFSALGITATVMSIETVRDLLAIDAFGRVVQALSRLMPYLLVIAAFTFVYLFIPNTRVRLGPALLGGAAGGIGWQTAGWAFATFIARSGNYAAIYSGFAILVLFMIWLYVSWLVLLFGASVAFYAQHPEYLYAQGGEPRLSNRMRERTALAAAALVAQRFAQGSPLPSLVELTRELGVPSHVLTTVLEALERGGYLVRDGADPPRYLLARDPAAIRVDELLETVRAAGEGGFLSPGLSMPTGAVDQVLARVQQAARTSIDGMTLRDLAAGDVHAPADGSAEGPAASSATGAA
ncbi:MAG: YihY family inner membrane protein [Piscinibacter sp.]|nr:YihY family inner membrane protein [Piscinibacter sp.]